MEGNHIGKEIKLTEHEANNGYSGLPKFFFKTKSLTNSNKPVRKGPQSVAT